MGRASTLSPWLPVVAWMGLIFALSADTSSGETSGRLMALLKAVLGEFSSPESEEMIHLGVRKLGHLVEYAVLYALVWRARVRTGAGPGWKVPLAVCVLYAITDEFHQAYVSNRVGTPTDVGVDAAGAALAALLLRSRAGDSRSA